MSNVDRRPRNSVWYFFFFGRGRGGLIFRPLNFFFFWGGGRGGVGSFRGFFVFRLNSIIPIIS